MVDELLSLSSYSWHMRLLRLPQKQGVATICSNGGGCITKDLPIEFLLIKSRLRGLARISLVLVLEEPERGPG
jgi:hypothetical protein